MDIELQNLVAHNEIGDDLERSPQPRNNSRAGTTTEGPPKSLSQVVPITDTGRGEHSGDPEDDLQEESEAADDSSKAGSITV